MTAKKAWLITGAGRGMGVDIALLAQAAANRGLSSNRALDGA
jgi:NAD(P)-dependent dehydrogenase (short-subunit alcohol dehydrogenase family)